jgi:L-iditol 2-dehydrogenase
VAVAEPLAERRELAAELGAEVVDPMAAADGNSAGRAATAGGNGPKAAATAGGNGPKAAAVAGGNGPKAAAVAGGNAAVAEAVAAALGGRPTVVMLATGAAAAWDLALSAADKGAIVQLFAPSGPGEARAFDVDDVFFREIEIQASYSAGPHDTRFALKLIADGAVPAERLVTHRFPLERTEEALAAARSREGVKVIVTSSA